MVVGILKVDLHIAGSNSLKGKRQVLRSLKDRMKGRFNVSVAEVGGGNLWQRATLGIAVVSNERSHANRILSKVVDLIESSTSVEVVDYEIELL